MRQRGSMHRSCDYKSLVYLEGVPLDYIGGLNLSEKPAEVTIYRDYPNTVLLELTFVKSYWSSSIPPRKMYRMVPKAALATGDVRLSIKNQKRYIYLDEISDLVNDADCYIGDC